MLTKLIIENTLQDQSPEKFFYLKQLTKRNHLIKEFSKIYYFV